MKEILTAVQALSARTTSVRKNLTPVTHPPVDLTQSAWSPAPEIQSVGVSLTMFQNQTQSPGAGGSVRGILTVAEEISARTTSVSPGQTRVTQHLVDQIQSAMLTAWATPFVHVYQDTPPSQIPSLAAERSRPERPHQTHASPAHADPTPGAM